jgi:hypothetical protein
LQQALVDVAFPRLPGDQVPEVAHFGLADAMDAAEALLQAVGVPGEVVVDHQVGALQVDAFASGVGRQEEVNVGVAAEALFDGAAGFTAEAAIYVDDVVITAEEGFETAVQVAQGVAVFGEDDEFAAGGR